MLDRRGHDSAARGILDCSENCEIVGFRAATCEYERPRCCADQQPHLGSGLLEQFTCLLTRKMHRCGIALGDGDEFLYCFTGGWPQWRPGVMVKIDSHLQRAGKARLS